MKWVTWENIGVDRMGCGWLILRFIDPMAEFVFVPQAQKVLPADAIPFDIPGVELSHHDGHCSFHALLKKHRLKEPVLQRIARIIDEADTVQPVLIEPSAPGLDLICKGIRLVSPDDATAMGHGLLVYDGLSATLAVDKPRTPESR